MRELPAAILDSVLAMPAEVVLGGVLLALLLALPVAGAYLAARRGKRDAAMTVVAASMVVNLVGMAIASGQIWRTINGDRSAVATPLQPTPGSPLAGDDDLTD